MTSPTISPNAYTDAPELHPNLILGSLQSLFWLFFHPSAWRNHVTRIDPTLPPDFALADLNLLQWRNAALRRLLLQCYGGWLSLASFPLIAALWVVDVASSSTMVFIIGGGIASAIAFSASVGTVGGVVIAVAGGAVCLVALAVYFTLDMGRDFVAVVEACGTALSVTSGTAVGLALAISSDKTTYSRKRQAAGIATGLLLCGGLGLVVFVIFELSDNALIFLVGSVTGAIVGGIGAGLRSKKWLFGAILGMLGGMLSAWAFLVNFSSAEGLLGGLSFSMFFSAAYGLPYVLAQRVGGTASGAIAGGLGGGVAILLYFSLSERSLGLLAPAITVVITATWPWWRPGLTYLPELIIGFLIFRTEKYRHNDQPCLLRWHPAFWDEFQRLPVLGLNEYLVLVIERNPAEGKAAIEYLATSHQRWAARAAQIELDARGLDRCADVMAISKAHRSLAAGELENPASALLRSFSRISQDIEAALHQESAYNQRLALSAIEDRMDGLLRELTRSSERYAVRFRPVVTSWRQIVAERIKDVVKAVEQSQEIDSPYVIGVPLTERQEIFVGRADISARIEQLLLDRRRPPLLLYGQRRMGKTSLLNNLGRLLPSTIIPLFVDLQGPASQASDHAGFLYNIARSMTESADRQRSLPLPALSRESLADDPFTRFDEWLDGVERVLGSNTALLILDEFESLDGALAIGKFSETAVLGMLRHLIQHRPRFKVLLAGSHTLDELHRWASYLINVQVVKLGYLKEAEARQLIEQPVKDFALSYEPEASRRVWDLTRGHPFLTQLLCAEIVALKNEQETSARRRAMISDVEAAAPEAINHGSLFFADIQRNQVDAAGLALLRYMAARGEGAAVNREDLSGQFADALEQTLDSLLRRDLIEPVNGGFSFQVEMIRRWFTQTGHSFSKIESR